MVATESQAGLQPVLARSEQGQRTMNDGYSYGQRPNNATP
ncbi:hypothetical protein SAMN05421874_11053 [Nonomuraea maritima]|uniref:Uncharacterized protein n=1 Tax=Nonomuraea maritima TaxID=683260 RepID=A0A1G9DY48_9ACTN|nr:hypothetical protein SAMN05421874_11053 [Nonomuraea maritima]